MTDTSKQEILALLGESPSTISRELSEFAEAARVLSSDQPRLIDKHRKQWIGVFGGEVKASGKTLKSLMTQLRQMDLPPEEAIIRFIDHNNRTFIL